MKCYIEALDWLNAIINDPTTCGGNLEDNNKALDIVKQEINNLRGKIARLEEYKEVLDWKETRSNIIELVDDSYDYEDFCDKHQGLVSYLHERDYEILKNYANGVI